MSGFWTNLIGRLRRLKVPAAARRFIAHNRKVFRQATEARRLEPVVLFELGQIRSAHIAYSYLASALAREHDARVIAYVPDFLSGWRQRLYFRIKQVLGLDPFGIYASFGTAEFMAMRRNATQAARAETLATSILPRLKTLRDVEELQVDGVIVGDLIYDSYLMTHLKPTIDIRSAEFREFLVYSLTLLIAWCDYLDSHDVRAINVTHCVYNIALPLRVAVKRGIPVYQANVTHIYRLTEKDLFAYNDFFYFPQRFGALPHELRERGIVEAERRIARRFSGEIGVDMVYSTKSAYSDNRYERLLHSSSNKKILIATHCFFDSPHSYGKNLFPDFYQWLTFLGNVSEQTDYDWYIKTHPDFLPGTKEIIDTFVKRYPKFTLLPADASHHQIIAEGIDVTLTTWGTIAFEYAALGIPVINASRNNPHIAYDFNFHPKDENEYRALLTNLDSLALKIDRRKVCEYYFMRHIFNTEDLFFESYEQAIEDLGGYYGQIEPAVYDRWLKEWTPERHEMIVAAVQNFIRSGDFRMDYGHYGRPFTLKTSKDIAA